VQQRQTLAHQLQQLAVVRRCRRRRGRRSVALSAPSEIRVSAGAAVEEQSIKRWWLTWWVSWTRFCSQLGRIRAATAEYSAEAEACRTACIECRCCSRQVCWNSDSWQSSAMTSTASAICWPRPAPASAATSNWSRPVNETTKDLEMKI